LPRENPNVQKQSTRFYDVH